MELSPRDHPVNQALASSQSSRNTDLTYIATLAVVVGCRFRLGLCVRISVFVVDGSQSIGLISKIAIGAEVGSHPVLGSGCTNALHNDIATLPDAKGHDVRGVRLDGDKVIGNDCHVVTVDREALDTFSTAVDEP